MLVKSVICSMTLDCLSGIDPFFLAQVELLALALSVVGVALLSFLQACAFRFSGTAQQS